jgi:ribonucleoside-diphosphate reductase beta chain
MENLTTKVDNDMRFVVKRSGNKVPYMVNKIENAVLKAMNSVGNVDEEMAEKIARITTKAIFRNNKDKVPHVDEIHDMVENKLMDNGLNEVAKEYIIYRSNNMPNIFTKRINLKPYEYPNLNEYVDAIRHSYWVHTEFNFTSDIQDYKVHLTTEEKSAVERAMLAISQIEIAVKTFWGDIYKRMPKPEIGNVGATFAESEVRHADAYSHLIQLLGLNDQFETLLEIPAIRRRIKYLEKSISTSKSVENKEYFESIVLFSMFVENVSLFSQFLVIMSFNKHKNKLKGISNAVEATSKEENIHAEFGFDLVNLIKKENPEWWTEELVDDLILATKEAYEAEIEIINWIFEEGDLEFLTKKQTMEFIKNRFNVSLNSIGIDSIFDVNDTLLETTEWFDDEILTTKHTDFFNKRSINYSKKSKSITSNDLF